MLNPNIIIIIYDRGKLRSFCVVNKANNNHNANAYHGIFPVESLRLRQMVLNFELDELHDDGNDKAFATRNPFRAVSVTRTMKPVL